MSNTIKKIAQLFGIVMFTGLALTSCVKGGLPNIEVDITNISSNSVGFIKANINENSATIFIDTMQTKLTDLSVLITVSEGATITPEPTSVKDYSEPRYFTIVSEDKEWSKTWEVNAQVVSEDFPTKYDFNNWMNPTNTYYKIPYEIHKKDDNTEDKMEVWASSNISMQIVLSYIYGPSLNYTHFGCCPSDHSIEGLALKMETIDIHNISATQPYVSGCCFIGEFDSKNTDPLLCTRFGTPFNKRPISFNGYYDYQPNVVLSRGTNDIGLIEAVLFKVDESTPYLTGYTIRDKSYKNIVAYAEFNPNTNSNGYQPFSIPFVYTQEVEDEDLKNWKYALAIYFASSKDGDQYIGANGTKLFIDNAEIVCE